MDNLNSLDLIKQFEDLKDRIEDLDQNELDEFQRLSEVCKEGEDYFHDWHHGVTLIHRRNFQDYAQELAEELCPRGDSLYSQWPYTCIDWRRAAEELQMDYIAIEIEGETYYGI